MPKLSPAAPANPQFPSQPVRAPWMGVQGAPAPSGGTAQMLGPHAQAQTPMQSPMPMQHQMPMQQAPMQMPQQSPVRAPWMGVQGAAPITGGTAQLFGPQNPIQPDRRQALAALMSQRGF